jgi:hypothetical protein
MVHKEFQEKMFTCIQRILLEEFRFFQDNGIGFVKIVRKLLRIWFGQAARKKKYQTHKTQIDFKIKIKLISINLKLKD